MNATKQQFLLEKFAGKVSPYALSCLREYMNRADDGAFDVLSMIKLKNFAVSFLLAFFFTGLGAGLFYLGEYIMAVFNIIITAVLVGIAIVLAINGMLIFYIIMEVVLFMFDIGSIAVTSSLVKNVNSNKLLTVIGYPLEK